MSTQYSFTNGSFVVYADIKVFIFTILPFSDLFSSYELLVLSSFQYNFVMFVTKIVPNLRSNFVKIDIFVLFRFSM